MFSSYAAIFWELIRKPFENVELVWGIVPLYFSWIFSELTGARANFKTAIQTGFNFLWAAAQWCWQDSHEQGAGGRLHVSGLFAVNVIVTFITVVFGFIALWSGVRRRFPRHWSFLGHTRFSSYLTIVIFPIQTNHLQWSWARLFAIVLFAIPIWLLLHYGLEALRLVKGGKTRG